MNNYGSVKKIVECPNYNDFTSIDGIGQSKVESFISCFRGPFDPDKKIYRKKDSEENQSKNEKEFEKESDQKDITEKKVEREMDSEDKKEIDSKEPIEK